MESEGHSVVFTLGLHLLLIDDFDCKLKVEVVKHSVYSQVPFPKMRLQQEMPERVDGNSEQLCLLLG